MKLLDFVTILLAVTLATGMPTTPVSAQPTEQAVIVHFRYGSHDLHRLFAVEDKLEAAIATAHAGEYDGNEIAVDGSEGSLYMYGPDADRLLEVVKPVLEATPFMRGAIVRKRYGPPESGVRESAVVISP